MEKLRSVENLLVALIFTNANYTQTKKETEREREKRE